MNNNNIGKYRIIIEYFHLFQCLLVDGIEFREIPIEVTIIRTDLKNKRPRNIASTQENEVFLEDNDLFSISEWHIDDSHMSKIISLKYIHIVLTMLPEKTIEIIDEYISPTTKK
jgi:hypothetical protein